MIQKNGFTYKKILNRITTKHVPKFFVLNIIFFIRNKSKFNKYSEHLLSEFITFLRKLYLHFVKTLRTY